MENKGVDGVRTATLEKKEAAAAACFRKTASEEATFTESARDRLRQFKDAPAVEHWACLKNKVRAGGEYATLRIRQGISMFGEPNIGAIKTIVDHF